MIPNWFQALRSTDYLPHRYCYLAKPGLVWTNVITDGLIAVSYAAIFACLVRAARRLRLEAEMKRYRWVFLAFAAFILACGTTHVMEAVTVWQPLYPLAAVFKVLCAAISVPTAVAFAVESPRLGRDLHHFIEMRQLVANDRDLAQRELLDKEALVKERESVANQFAALNAQLNGVMDSTSDGILKVRHDWTIAYGNQAAVVSLRDFAKGKSLWDCFPGLASTEAERNLRECMELRVTREYENYYAEYDQWFSVHASPMPGGISIFFSDISAEKRLREQLEKERWLREKRIQSLSHMAGGLAHEISNPLAIIYGRASDLYDLAAQGEAVSVEEIKKASESILTTSDRAIRILRGLRGFGRDAAKDAMQCASLYEIVAGCVELQQARAERHHVALKVFLAPDLPEILCREVQIGQIVTNLLNNAFDEVSQSAQGERWMALSVTADDKAVQIEVTDSGVGIPEHVRSHLMEPFFTTKEVGLGMGVGLSLSKAIAEDHGGSLELLSPADRTTFRLTLPIDPPTSTHDGSVWPDPVIPSDERT